MSNPVRFILLFLFSVMWAAVSMAVSMAAQAQPAPPAMPVTKVVKETLDAPALPPGSMGGQVVIELFTAKSCVFCPQAEQLFAELAGQPGVIALACHVDYLKDGDALAQDFCMERQNWYMDRLHAGPNYTPQLIVNGNKDAVGYKTDIVTALVHQKRGDAIAPIAIRTLNVGEAGTQFAVTLPDGAVKESGKRGAVAAPGLLTGWQLAVTTFHRPVTPEAGGASYVRVADNMQILPLDRYKGPAFKLTVPLSDAQGGVVVVLQRQDTGRIAAAGQFLKEQAQPVR